MNSYLIWFEAVGMGDAGKVGGKNASLGEMIGQLAAKGVTDPGGFATTADAYREFLAHEGLDARIKSRLASLNIDDVTELAAAGAQIRQWIVATPFPQKLEKAIIEAYRELETKLGHAPVVAVRSSATAEDLPEASFAGQQETFLNVRAVALSAGIQQMVRSDIGASGVVFTLDTESCFRDVVLITAAYGLGETVVQGAVNPDEFYVHKETLAAGRPALLRRNLGAKAIKMIYSDDRAHGRATRTVDVPAAERLRFCLSDAQVQDLARQAGIIETHYRRPTDTEWGGAGEGGK